MTDDAKPLDAVLVKDYDDSGDYSLTGSGVRFTSLSDEERIYLVNTFETNRRRFRRGHLAVLHQQERLAAKTVRLRNLFTQDKTWAAVGGDTLISDMTPNHALNSYNLIVNEWNRYAGFGISFTDLKTGYVDAYSTPLAKALRKRSEKRPTKKDKRKDNEARERFKDRQAKARAFASNFWEHEG